MKFGSRRKPAPRNVRLMRKGQFLVAVPLEKGSVLSAKTVRETLNALRRRQR
jgi:hypothetical protein